MEYDDRKLRSHKVNSSLGISNMEAQTTIEQKQWFCKIG